MARVLDFRNTESISTAGLPITTFMSESKEIIWVSLTDLIDQLGLKIASDELDTETFIVYDIIGRPTEHECIVHTDINGILWGHDGTDWGNLLEFRQNFAHEVMNFWTRFHSSPSNLTIREAFMKVDNGAADIATRLDIPLGRIREFVFTCMGFKVIPGMASMSTEEYAFISYAEIQYLSLLAQYIGSGEEVHEAARQVEKELQESLTGAGQLTRGLAELCNTKYT